MKRAAQAKEPAFLSCRVCVAFLRRAEEEAEQQPAARTQRRSPARGLRAIDCRSEAGLLLVFCWPNTSAANVTFAALLLFFTARWRPLVFVLR